MGAADLLAHMRSGDSTTLPPLSTVNSPCCLQARLPYPIGVYSHRLGGQNPWLHLCWKLPAATGRAEERERDQKHANMMAKCALEVVPVVLTAEQDRRLAALCKHPVISLSKTAVTFLLKEVLSIGGGANRTRTARKHERLENMVEDPDVYQQLGDFIAAGYNVADMRFMNGRQRSEEFNNFMLLVRQRLEERSLLAAEERRRAPGGDMASAQAMQPQCSAPVPWQRQCGSSTLP